MVLSPVARGGNSLQTVGNSQLVVASHRPRDEEPKSSSRFAGESSRDLSSRMMEHGLLVVISLLNVVSGVSVAEQEDLAAIAARRGRKRTTLHKRRRLV